MNGLFSNRISTQTVVAINSILVTI